jgi:CRP/FNR family transcriptional regulator, nitrogen fixation regulation protein
MINHFQTDFANNPATASVHSKLVAPEPSWLVAKTTQYRRGEVICRQGYVANYWYSVTRGLATRYVIRADGRRHLLELLLPGDFFGFSRQGDHESTSEAMSDDTVIVQYPRHRIEKRILSEASQTWSICEALIEALSRLEDHLLVVGRVTASEKVGSFLLDIERRIPGRTTDIQLPISRYDIADYLGISVETVSRALSDLTRRGCIQLTGPRDVKIVNRDTLAVG